MNAAFFSVDATQWVGLAAFGLAAAVCFKKARGKASAWWFLAALNALLAIEIVVGLRYRVHDLVDSILIAKNSYTSRQPWQVGMIVFALCLFFVGVFAARSRIQSASLALATVGMGFAVGIFVIEAISLHAVDLWMYREFGPLKLIALLWLTASAWICWAALRPANSQTQP